MLTEKLEKLTYAHTERAKQQLEANVKFEALLRSYTLTNTRVESLRLYVSAAREAGKINLSEEEVTAFRDKVFKIKQETAPYEK